MKALMSKSKIEELVEFLTSLEGVNDKSIISTFVKEEFNLVVDRSVYYCDDYALRFSSSNSLTFGNTVLSLSVLQKYDDRPFIVILVTPQQIHCLLANTTLLKKISHSSHELRTDNIKGSFNGSDISRELCGITNESSNLDALFTIHSTVGFEENLPRLVEATNNISATGKKFIVSDHQWSLIESSPVRAKDFVSSDDFIDLKQDLDNRVQKFSSEILLAGLIENVNVRGRVIEYLIAGEDEALREEIILSLNGRKGGIPVFKTGNSLGDFSKEYPQFKTETDVKTKVMILNSNPKGYNIDKILEFLSQDRSVFLFYFVGIEPMKILGTVLVSMFQTDLLKSTLLLKHWAGRNSRGVTQFEGKTLHELILNPSEDIE